MKFTKNRLLSLLLVLAMLFALATTAFAEGEGGSSSGSGGTPSAVTAKSIALKDGDNTVSGNVTLQYDETKTYTAVVTGSDDQPMANATVEWTLSDGGSTYLDLNKGVVKAKAITSTPVTLTAKVAGTDVSTTLSITVAKKQITAPDTTLPEEHVSTSITDTELKTKLDSKLATALGNNASLFTLTGDWTPTTANYEKTDGASQGFTKVVSLKDTTNYQIGSSDATSLSITCNVYFHALPTKPTITTPPATSTVCALNEGSKTLSVVAASATGTELRYEWHRKSSNGVDTVVPDKKGGNTSTCTIDTATAGTFTYYCNVYAVKSYGTGANAVELKSEAQSSGNATVIVRAPYKVTLSYSDGYGTSSARVGNTLVYTATAKVYDPAASDKDADGYRPAKDTDKLSFTFSTTDSEGRVSGAATGTNSYYVYLSGAKNTSANTVKVTATLKINNVANATYTDSVSRTYYPAAATNITINPISSNAALMDETSILSAVNSAIGSSIYTSYSVNYVNFTTNSTYGSFSTTGVNSNTYSQNGYVSTATYKTPKINSIYFVPSSSYVGFPSTSMYVAYYAYDSAGYVLATGSIYFTSASSITYNATASTPVYFKASDFSDYFKTALGGTYNSSYYTLSEVTFGTPRVSNSSVTSGTLYYNNGYVYSTTRVPAANLGYVSYTPSSSTYTYTVSIPFTAYGTYYYGSTATKTVSGTVTIKVNDGHVITMVGTDFKSASIWSDITSKHPGVSYVSFSQPQSTVGKLYYGYSSIASKGSLVSYTDRFNNSNYNYSYANTIKSIDGIYFVPAADCLDTVTLTYTAYTSATATTGVSDTITFTITKKTASSIFNDVTASNTGKWSADAIDFLARNSIVEGGSYGTFNPNGNMTRGDFVLMLYRMAGKPSVSGISNPFTDVKSSDYYYNAILWAYRNDIVTGVDAKTFAPKKNITREQIAATLYRMAGSPSTSGYLTGYYDYAKIHSYATNAMRWAISNGVITGSNGYLTPTNNATRAQVAAMLHRYLTK